MKGLIRNNFYSVGGALKSTLLLSLIAALVLAFVGKATGNSTSLFSIIISGNLGAFGAIAATAIQKDEASKWDKFELTMPVSRRDVINARYISCMLYILIGLLMSIISVLVFYLVTGSVNLERTGYGFAFGIGFALSIPTFLLPLTIIFGTDKTEPFMLVSIVAGLLLFFGSSAIMSPFLDNISNSNFIFRASYVIFSVVLFVVSYLLSCCIYKKKEL